MKSSGAESKDSKKASENGAISTDIELRLRERIRTRQENRGGKKWNKTRIIMLINILLLMVLIVMYQNENMKQPAQYSSVRIETPDLDMRVSIGKEPDSIHYTLSLSVTNRHRTNLSLPLSGGLAVIDYFNADMNIYQKKIAPGMKRLVLNGDETRTFMETIDASFFDTALRDKKKKRFNILRQPDIVTLRADCKILLENPANGMLTFTHEVNR